jgi:hypothetical protein
MIVPEERDLADALIQLAEKYGKFNEDKTGIWAGYTPAAENEVADIGVTCANCVLYEGGSSCKIIEQPVEPMGKCRFAVIPDGVVSVETASAEAVFADSSEDKYISGINQPRDASGQFRKVLALIKENAGASGLDSVINKVEEAENFDDAGNYTKAVGSARQLIGIIDRLDSGALNAEALENIRSTSQKLGQVIANLPLPFGKDAEKVRFSDLPPALRDLIDDMMKKVEEKIGKKDADIATAKLRSYKAGSDVYSQGEVSSDMSTLLRLLT